MARVSESPSILAIVPEGTDRAVLRALSDTDGWEVFFADSPKAMAIRGEPLRPIIFYDRRFAGYDWREAVRSFTRSSSHPFVILLSPTFDQNLWEELERIGGSDILRSPIEQERTRRAVNRAWWLWRNEQNLRTSSNCAGPRLSR
jgi:CheY-like chemotaxis protein